MFKVPEKNRIKNGPMGSNADYGNNGAFSFLIGKNQFVAIASDQMGWEHVSVSTPSRCPTWEEMCKVKSMFWDEDDCVIQYHPAKSEYVNNHPYCLHLWRPEGQDLPKPPSFMVGVQKSEAV